MHNANAPRRSHRSRGRSLLPAGVAGGVTRAAPTSRTPWSTSRSRRYAGKGMPAPPSARQAACTSGCRRKASTIPRSDRAAGPSSGLMTRAATHPGATHAPRATAASSVTTPAKPAYCTERAMAPPRSGYAASTHGTNPPAAVSTAITSSATITRTGRVARRRRASLMRAPGVMWPVKAGEHHVPRQALAFGPGTAWTTGCNGCFGRSNLSSRVANPAHENLPTRKS
jgi:hypothetical protein